MAVAFDAVASAAVFSSGGAALTWTHTPAGVPTAVAVLFYNQDSVATVTSVTYGGVTMTQSVHQLGGGNQHSAAYLYGLANPPSGAQTVTINLSASSPVIAAGSITVTGSDTTTCFSNTAGAPTSAATTQSLGVTSATGEFVVDVLGTDGSGGSPYTPGGSQTTRFGPLNFGTAIGSSQPGAGSVTMSWTWTGVANSAMAAGSFKAAGAGGGGFFSRYYYEQGKMNV